MRSCTSSASLVHTICDDRGRELEDGFRRDNTPLDLEDLINDKWQWRSSGDAIKLPFF